jgi:hypothetical protein
MMGAGIYKKKEGVRLCNDATMNMHVMPERIWNETFVV